MVSVYSYTSLQPHPPSFSLRLHEFVWHGTDPSDKTRKVPGALKFTKLRVIPDQFYYNSADVRLPPSRLQSVILLLYCHIIALTHRISLILYSQMYILSMFRLCVYTDAYMYMYTCMYYSLYIHNNYASSCV